MLLVLALALCVLYSPKPSACAPKAQKGAAAAAAVSAPGPQYYFWNQITGELQWEDPGDVPFEDEAGIRYWLGPGGEKLSEDSNSHSYNWVEYYSEDLQKTYYHNQMTKETTWEKPSDLAWRRVPVRR